MIKPGLPLDKLPDWRRQIRTRDWSVPPRTLLGGFTARDAAARLKARLRRLQIGGLLQHDESSNLQHADSAVEAADPRASQADVIWAYRTLLGREPEDETAITAALRVERRWALVRGILESREFRAVHGPDSGKLDLTSPALPVQWDTDRRTLDALLERVASTWQWLGEQRPHWSVATHPEYLPENIVGNEERFWSSGRQDLDSLLGIIERVGRSPDQFEIVFEYGCGVGRTTMHLATRFQRVLACDISSSHLDLARTRARQRGVSNVDFILAQAPDFGMTAPIDLWFSRIVLQHNTPPIMAMILRRALQLLRDGGLAIFQVPTYSPGYRFEPGAYLSAPFDPTAMEMHVLPQRAIFQIASEAECVPVEVLEDGSTGDVRWFSNSFAFAKPAIR